MPNILFRVQTDAGLGIPEATISLSTSAQTNDDGEISAHIPAGKYVGTVSAPGYVTRTLPWTFGSDGTVIIGLETGTPDPPPSQDAIDIGEVMAQANDWNDTTEFTPL